VSSSANLPAPYLGQDTQTPTAALKSPYCETLYNFNTTKEGISLRNGDSKWVSKSLNTTGGATSEEAAAIVKYGETYAFIVCYCAGPGLKNRYYDISTEGAAPTLAYTSTTMSYQTIYTSYFNQYLFFFNGQDQNVDYFNGSAWGAATYTMPVGLSPIGGCTFKNRHYIIFKDSASLGYSGIKSISGTITEVPLAGVISNASTIAAVVPFNVTISANTEQVLAVVFFSGEVLFYTGSYPDSDSWGLVGTANIGKPIHYNSVVTAYQGDSLVACYTGLVSLRDVYTNGSIQAEQQLITQSITPDWTDLTNRIYATYGSIQTLTFAVITWWKEQGRLVVTFCVQPSSSTIYADVGSTFFVYDTLRRSWSVHRTFGGVTSAVTSYGAINFKGKLLFIGVTTATSTQKIIIKSKEGATDFQDVNYDDTTKTSYDYSFVSAPIPFPKTAVYETVQIEPILESDLYAETNWNFVVDFGRQTSGNQKTDASTSSVSKPAVNVGMQNITYVQVKMSGTTAASKTVGLDLYSYNVWYNAGETGSR